MRAVLIDAGPLVAFLDRSDNAHEAVVKALEEIQDPESGVISQFRFSRGYRLRVPVQGKQAAFLGQTGQNRPAVSSSAKSAVEVFPVGPDVERIHRFFQ